MLIFKIKFNFIYLLSFSLFIKYYTTQFWSFIVLPLTSEGTDTSTYASCTINLNEDSL